MRLSKNRSGLPWCSLAIKNEGFPLYICKKRRLPWLHGYITRKATPLLDSVVTIV